MTNQAAIVRNMKSLMEAAVAEMQAAGWDEARIIEQLPYLAREAVAFLQLKAAH